MAARCRLLAGSFGPERLPARPDPEAADWHLPLHLRAPGAARERLAAQVVAGADVVVAPTWLTHRRALLPLGETRRVGAWTAAAVSLAREAVELGLERRAAAVADGEVGGGDDGRQGWSAPLVAATLPALDDEPEVATGRLLPHEAATERDYRDQAGQLAEAEPDVILVEGQRSESDARVAIGEAVATGLPVWAALTPGALAGDGIDAWLEWAGAVGVDRLLLPGPAGELVGAADTPLSWGGLTREPASVRSWLEAGATAIALLDGALAPLVERLREAIDEYEGDVIRAARAAERRWWTMVERAAAMAPAGHAVWLGPAPSRALPAGFDWLVLEASEVAQLPSDHYRLVVAPGGPGRLERILERGGLSVGRFLPGTRLRLLTLDETTAPPVAIYRRED